MKRKSRKEVIFFFGRPAFAMKFKWKMSLDKILIILLKIFFFLSFLSQLSARIEFSRVFCSLPGAAT